MSVFLAIIYLQSNSAVRFLYNYLFWSKFSLPNFTRFFILYHFHEHRRWSWQLPLTKKHSLLWFCKQMYPIHAHVLYPWHIIITKRPPRFMVLGYFSSINLVVLDTLFCHDHNSGGWKTYIFLFKLKFSCLEIISDKTYSIIQLSVFYTIIYSQSNSSVCFLYNYLFTTKFSCLFF